MGLHDGAVVLVTGGASGIGRAAAGAFAREGARMVVVADLDEVGGSQAIEEIVDAGGRAEFERADVTREAEVSDLIAGVRERHGRLDAAFNNAGRSDPPRAFHEMEIDVWERMLATNLTSVFLCMKHEILGMLEQEARGGRRGAIVNTSSGAGIVPAPGQPHYTAAKHGVLGLTKCAAQDYATAGIRTNAILPGLTDTPMVRSFLDSSPPEIRKALRASVPGGELGLPADVAAAAVWLCSDAARWINGQGLIVDGGGVLR